jgi:CitMHS family citrate-Mg2+:H+ or citrate-Ca2+:H+ symporter
MMSIVGLLTILVIVALLITQRVHPIIALTTIPFIGALIAGFGLSDITEFFNDGIASVLSVVIMFIFAILFFGIMQDAGMFNPLIDRMVKISRGNIIVVAVVTVVIGALAHMDGAGASTFLITIPALLPLYKKLNMSPYLLVLLVGLSASIINMVPWAGPLGRTAAVLGTDAGQLWGALIPLQIISVILLLIFASFLGWMEKRRIERKGLTVNTDASVLFEETGEVDSEVRDLERPKLLWFNLLLVALVIVFLVTDLLPAGLIFMIALCIALVVNYPDVELQKDRLAKHAPNALMMGSIILAAGTFLGIMDNSGMLESLAEDIVNILPAFIVPYLHYVIGILGVPFELILNTDAYYFALLPVVDNIVSPLGVENLEIAYSLMIGNIIGTFVSPFSPALWLAVGLAGIEMGRYIKYAFFWIWGFSIIVMLVAFFLGII